MRFAYATCQHRVETKRLTRVKREGDSAKRHPSGWLLMDEWRVLDFDMPCTRLAAAAASAALSATPSHHASCAASARIALLLLCCILCASVRWLTCDRIALHGKFFAPLSFPHSLLSFPLSCFALTCCICVAVVVAVCSFVIHAKHSAVVK